MICNICLAKYRSLKKCTKCNCNFKLHIANRSLRRSCNYHNFINDYCFDCGLFRYQIKNSKCLHIYIKNDCHWLISDFN